MKLCQCKEQPPGYHDPGCSFAAKPAPRCSSCGYRGKTTLGCCPFCGQPREDG